MLVLRLGKRDEQRGVIHLARFIGPVARWRSRCPVIHEARPYNDQGPSEWWQPPSVYPACSGRFVTLTDSPPDDVPVCRFCLRAWRREVAYVEDWLIERGVL